MTTALAARSWDPAIWSRYCVYSGKHHPASALNDEHVVPKSLGGYRSTVIRAERRLNALLATKVDAAVAKDSAIALARRKANAKGHSGRPPVARIRNARSWQAGQPSDAGEKRYTVEFHPDGSTRAWDQRTQTYLPPGTFNTTGFIVDPWHIDHSARLRFTAKTLLGVGWKLFGPHLLDAVDVKSLRTLMLAEPADVVDSHGLGFTDPFLARGASPTPEAMIALETALIRDRLSTILIRENDGHLEWAVACLGEMIGVLRVPLAIPLIEQGKRSGGVRLELTRGGLTVDALAGPSAASPTTGL